MTDKQIEKYCDGLDCSWCNEKEPCIYKIANELEKKLLAKEQECERLKEKYKWYDHYKEQALYNKNLCNKKSEQLNQLKVELKEVNNFLTDIASYISYNGEPPTNLNEVRICIKDICKVNQNLDKNATKYRQALQKVKKIAEMCRASLYGYDQEKYSKQILQKINEVLNDR